MKKLLLVALVALLALPILPIAAQDAPTNLLDTCVTDFDPEMDYFPDKVEIDYAEGLAIEYFNNYKVVTVLTPWTDADETFQYVLVQCGTPAPEAGFEDAQVIETPIDSIITLSTTQLPHLVELGVVDRLIGVENTMFISAPEVVEMAGDLIEVGGGAEVNVEMVLDAEPDLVMASGSGFPEYDAHPVLLDAGVSVAINAEWVEASPLGRAEWLKFTAAFFNAEAAANQMFEEVVSTYDEMVALTADIPAEDRPTVFANTPWEGAWYMPGGASYIAQFLADAGANYLWADDETTGSLYLDFETVLETAQAADYWVNAGSFNSLDEMLAADERYAEFAAFENDRVYSNNGRISPNGGNDFYESGVMRPDLVLADLVAIFHPDLLSDHEFVYYQPLTMGE